MKLFRRSISILLIAVFMFSFANFNAIAEEIDYWETDRLVHSAEYYFAPIEETVYYESDEYAKYAYIIKKGEASIVNIHITYQGDEKFDLVLPTNLGGYPVTAIGYEYYTEGSIGNEIKSTVDATYYINHGKDVFEEYPELDYYPDYDPGLSYISCLIIPEGYKEIYSGSLLGVSCVSFPNSLRYLGNSFESLHTYDSKCTELPECEIEATRKNVLSFKGDLILPSRFAENAGELFYLARERKNIYVPSNVSKEDFQHALYYYEGDIGDIISRYDANCIVHCAPDSEFISVWENFDGHKYANIVTDVIPAEYIAFPSETVNVHVGEVMDLEAKTYPTDAIWTACDYTVSDPSIVKIDEYSGRITALKEGTVTVTATHCERGYVDTCTVNVTTKPEPGVNGIESATDTPYVTYGNRDYKVNVTGSPSKIQVVRDNGGTTTIDRRKAQVTSNGDTETWIVNMRVEAGTHNIRAKYGKVWDDKLTPFNVKYDLPGAYSFDLTYENGIGNFDVVTDPEVIKIQFALDNGCTLTYSQTNSYIGEDGLRHWEISRKIPTDMTFTLKTKYGYTWTTTNFEVNTIV